MLAIRLEDRAALSVGGIIKARSFSAECDATGFLIERGAEVLHGAGAAFQFGKEPSHRLRVVPNMRARAMTAAHALPRPEPAIFPPLDGIGRQRGDGHHQAVDEP